MNLSDRDREIIWHPYTQTASEEAPIPIISARGAKLFTEDGREIIDAISSWWVNLHGHTNPYITQKIIEQMNDLEQVIFAGFTHKPAIKLGEKLIEILPENQNRIFYTDDGSTAVEVAIKMVLQYHHNRGDKRNRLIAVEGAYHGDTFGSMSVSQRGAFNKPFEQKLFEVTFIPFPSRENIERSLSCLEMELRKGDVAGLIIEPLVQGASGMRFYSPEELSAIVRLSKKYDALIIADEVFTGFARTGRLFAFDYISEKPDIVTLSKALTGGFLPLGVTSTTEEIYNAFLSPAREKMLLHGHSYTANPLACAAAIASIELLERQEAKDSINRISKSHADFVEKIRDDSRIKDARAFGTIMAFDVVGDSGYYSNMRGKLLNHFLNQGVLVRPLGNIVYCVPPLCTTDQELSQIYNAMKSCLEIDF